jgi:hypothetical protein
LAGLQDACPDQRVGGISPSDSAGQSCHSYLLPSLPGPMARWFKLRVLFSRS